MSTQHGGLCHAVRGTCEQLSEAYLIPVLEALRRSFPFIIRGFHSDNRLRTEANFFPEHRHPIRDPRDFAQRLAARATATQRWL